MLLMVGGTGSALTAVLRAGRWLEEYINLTPPLLIAWIACAVATVAAACGMWAWRRWGFILALQSIAAAAGIELYLGPPWLGVARLPALFLLLMWCYAPHRERFY